MQFNLKTQVFGANKMTVERNTFCSVFTGQPSTDPEQTKGLEVTKVSCDPAVFDQLPADFKPGDYVEFIATMKRAAQGKSQPYFIGVVPSKTASPSTSATQAKTA